MAILSHLKIGEKNPKDIYGCTPLHLAANEDICILIAKKIIKRNRNHKTNNGFTPLHYAARNGLNKFYQTMLFCNEINPQNNDSLTPLHEAAAVRNLRILHSMNKVANRNPKEKQD